MPKRTIDELLATIDAVERLRIVVARHEMTLERLLDRLDAVEQRLAVIESHQRPA